MGTTLWLRTDLVSGTVDVCTDKAPWTNMKSGVLPTLNTLVVQANGVDLTVLYPNSSRPSLP